MTSNKKDPVLVVLQMTGAYDKRLENVDLRGTGATVEETVTGGLIGLAVVAAIGAVVLVAFAILICRRGVLTYKLGVGSTEYGTTDYGRPAPPSHRR